MLPDECRAAGVTITPSKLPWWRVEIPPVIVVSIFLFGILQHWLIGIIPITADTMPEISRCIGSLAGFGSSVGGLVGFAVSRKRGRGALVGALTGAIVSAALLSP
jgi:hypothetical protein